MDAAGWGDIIIISPKAISSFQFNSLRAKFLIYQQTNSNYQNIYFGTEIIIPLLLNFTYTRTFNKIH